MRKQHRTLSAFWLLAAGFLLTALNTMGQTKFTSPADLFKTGDYQQGTSTNDGSTLFCAETAGFTLVSSTQDAANNLAYTGYKWEELNTDGSTYTLLPNGATPHRMSISTPPPGWHVYRVTASVASAGCEADPSYFTVYVLPKLVVTPRVNKTDAEGVGYCSETGAPTGGNAIVFTGTVAFDGTPRTITGLSLPALTIADFALNYAWYKVDAASVRTAVGTDQDSHTLVDPAAPGTSSTYTIQLDVKYTMTPKAGACGPYNGTGLYSGTSTTTATVNVWKKADKPTITIE